MPNKMANQVAVFLLRRSLLVASDTASRSIPIRKLDLRRHGLRDRGCSKGITSGPATELVKQGRKAEKRTSKIRPFGTTRQEPADSTCPWGLTFLF